MQETAMQTPRPVKKEERRCFWHQTRDSSAAYGEDHGEVGCRPASYGGPQWSRGLPAVHGGPHVIASGCIQRSL